MPIARPASVRSLPDALRLFFSHASPRLLGGKAHLDQLHIVLVDGLDAFFITLDLRGQVHDDGGLLLNLCGILRRDRLGKKRLAGRDNKPGGKQPCGSLFEALEAGHPHPVRPRFPFRPA